MEAHEKLRQEIEHFERNEFKGWRWWATILCLWDRDQYLFSKKLVIEYQELKERLEKTKKGM